MPEAPDQRLEHGVPEHGAPAIETVVDRRVWAVGSRASALARQTEVFCGVRLILC